MRNLKIRLSPKNFLIIFSYVLYLCVSILAMSFYYSSIAGNKMNAILAICVLMIFIEEIINRFLTAIEFAFISGITLFSIILLFTYEGALGFNSILYLLLFSFCARKINKRKLMITTIIIEGLLLIFIILSAKSGIILNYTTHALKGNVQYLGFRYSLYPAALLSNITLIYIYLRDEKLRFYEVFAVIAVNYLMFQATVSRLYFYLNAVGIIFIYLKKRWKLHMSLIMQIMSYAFVIYSISSVFLVVFYNSSSTWMNAIDQILFEGRLALQNKVVSSYGLSLFPQNIMWSGNALSMEGIRPKSSYLYADTLYINIILKYGMLLSAILVIIVTYALCSAYKQKKDTLLVILFIIATHGLIDDLVQYLYFNAFLLLIVELIIEPTYRRYFERKSISNYIYKR